MISAILCPKYATRLRESPGTYDAHGKYVPGAIVSTTITGNFQPFPGARLQSLQEGERQQGQLEIYTSFDLRTADQYTGASADRIVYKGITYEVREVDPWDDLLVHHRARLMRVQEGS